MKILLLSAAIYVVGFCPMYYLIQKCSRHDKWTRGDHRTLVATTIVWPCVLPFLVFAFLLVYGILGFDWVATRTHPFRTLNDFFNDSESIPHQPCPLTRIFKNRSMQQ